MPNHLKALQAYGLPLQELIFEVGMDMPIQKWNEKRVRQYEHNKKIELENGVGKKVVEEFTALTVNKEHAQQGEAKSIGINSKTATNSK